MSKKKSKPIMRDLDTVPHYEVQSAVDKIKRKREKNLLIREEMDRQYRIEHPTLAKYEPYITALEVIGGIALFFVIIYLIFLVNNSVDPTITPINMILMRL
jgi:hypothetical protein